MGELFAEIFDLAGETLLDLDPFCLPGETELFLLSFGADGLFFLFLPGLFFLFTSLDLGVLDFPVFSDLPLSFNLLPTLFTLLLLVV